MDANRLPGKLIKMATAPTVQTSSARRRRTDDDKKAVEEAAEGCGGRKSPPAERLLPPEPRGTILGAATGSVAQTLATNQIEMPGPGELSCALLPYLQAFLKQQWRKPTTSRNRRRRRPSSAYHRTTEPVVPPRSPVVRGLKSLDSSVGGAFGVSES